MISRIKDSRGFTLIEIIIALALIAIIAVALYTGVEFVVQRLANSDDYMQKNYVIQRELDDFIGTKDSTGTLTESISITWSTPPSPLPPPTVPNFIVTGIRLDKQSDAFHFDETFKAFVPRTISP